MRLAQILSLALLILFVLLACLLGFCARCRPRPARVLVGGARRNEPLPPRGKQSKARLRRARDSRLARRPIEKPEWAPLPGSRGAELDAAIVPAPLLSEGLPPGWWGPFDLEDGKFGPARLGERLFYGINTRDDPARSTLLTPHKLAAIAKDTSSRLFAWFVLDSPEGCFAVKARPHRGLVRKLDPDRILDWIKPRLFGDPPHKLELAPYLSFLRDSGLTIETGARRYEEVRFDLLAMTSASEREKAHAALKALSEDDFRSLDWRLYDEVAGAAAAASQKEVAGDVHIDLDAREVSAPKVRPGTLYSAAPHARAYVTFHTHPAARYYGSAYEPPSPGDLSYALWAGALHSMVWHFVTAPEGTYILRPGSLLLALCRESPRDAEARVHEAYSSSLNCVGRVLTCAGKAVEAMREAGFVAYFREHPLIPLAEQPDAVPHLNIASPGEYRAALKALSALAPDELLASDWSRVVDAARSPLSMRPLSSWVRASYKDGAVLPMDSHSFGDPQRPASYPSGLPGPLLVFCFPDAEFPPTIPAAALEAVRANSENWAWAAFLSERRVTVFRADPTGVLVAGPRRFGK